MQDTEGPGAIINQQPNKSTLHLGRRNKGMEIRLPFYYSNDMMFQMGPLPHNVWGYSNGATYSIEVNEFCKDGYSESNEMETYLLGLCN